MCGREVSATVFLGVKTGQWASLYSQHLGGQRGRGGSKPEPTEPLRLLGGQERGEHREGEKGIKGEPNQPSRKPKYSTVNSTALLKKKGLPQKLVSGQAQRLKELAGETNGV